MVERRHFKRIMYQAPATLHQADGSWQTDVRDLSLQGILITRPEAGTQVKMTLTPSPFVYMRVI